MTILKHPKHKDICYVVNRIMYSDSNKIKMKVTCFNMGFVESFVIIPSMKLNLTQEKYREYEEIKTYHPPKCLRDLPWRNKGVDI